MSEPPVRIDPRTCRRCGRCATVCPHALLAPPAGADPPHPVDGARDACLACGHCAAACPTGAAGLAGSATGPLPEAPPPPAPATVLTALRSRRSVRRYDGRPVPRDVVASLLEAARHAPTGHNAREVGCVAVLSAGRRERLRRDVLAFYRRLFRAVRHRAVRPALALAIGPSRVRELVESLPGAERAEARLRRGEDPLLHAAPAVLLFHAPDRETSEADCALAADHVSLLAPALGLGTCHIGYVSAVLKRSRRLARRHGVPRGHRVYAVLTAGYPAVTFRRVPARPPLAVRFR